MTRLPTFRGGIKIPEYKELTEGKEIQTLALPPRVFIHLKQSAGAPPQPVVKTGQAVKAGEVIARPSGAISSTLHASVAGRVAGISRRPHPAGPDGLAIEIETDPDQQPTELLAPLKNWEEIPPEEIRNRVLQAGIVGMGGAGFPTQVKLTPAPGTRIEYAIINGAECEPFLTVDHRLLLEEAEKVSLGLMIIMRATGAPRGIVGIEANKEDAFEKIRETIARYRNVGAELVKVKYPQGSEKQLIYSLLRRVVPAGGLPSAVGCVVQNVHTAVAISEAVTEGKPLTGRVVTVTGPALKNPGNFRVPIGTPFSHLIAAAGGLNEGPVKLISGGPMMGVAQYSLETPVLKGTSGILILREISPRRNLPCIRCGSCLRSCPMGLVPCDLARAVEKGKREAFEKLGGTNCFECGACAYACPAGRDLIQLIQLGKSLAQKAKAKKI